MTADDLDHYLREHGLKVETVTDAKGHIYTAVMGFVVPCGPRKGEKFDLAIQRYEEQPYVLPSAVHVRPVMWPMGTRNAQASALGSDWQYLSRRLDRPPSPKVIWAHVLTVVSEP